MRSSWFVLTACALAAATSVAWAQSYQADVGYSMLQAEQGQSLYTGAKTPVMQVEADVANDPSDPNYEPDPADSQFSKIDFNFENTGTFSSGNHASSVGEYYYGNTSSFSPGITSVDVYEADSWLQSSFIGTGEGTNNLPMSTSDRVINNSWIGENTDKSGKEIVADDLDALHRVDYVVENSACINVAACNNPNNGGQMSLLADSFNSILVGLTSGQAASETTNLNDSVYTAGRAAPDVVAPSPPNETSFATPMVASTAALLVDLGHYDTALSNGTFVADGQTMQYAEAPDVIKAAIMAGADRVTSNTSTDYQISNYGASPTQNGLDTRYGAGQLDVYNSYHVLLGKQQGPGSISTYGFDYNPASANGDVEDYTFTGQDGVAATLAWNVHIDNSLNATLAHYQFALYQITGGSGSMSIAVSASMIDNTQNIFELGLNPADTYELQVSRNDLLGNWDYGLAWDLDPVPEPASGIGVVLGMMGVMTRRRRVQIRSPKSEIRSKPQAPNPNLRACDII